MTTHRYNDNSFKGAIIVCLFTVLILKSCIVDAQSLRGEVEQTIFRKVNAWEDSIKKLNPRKFPKYFGGELSLAFPQYILKSKIDQLSKLPVAFMGTNVGGVWGNPMGKVKANLGMYYSDTSVPYTIEMLQAGVSTSVYFLRLKQVKYHTFEPYASVGVTFQRNTYYGNYLPTDQHNNPIQASYSTSDAPLLGRTGHGLMNMAAGVEYQLESQNNFFIHLFAEVGYGVALASDASRHDFKGTALSNLTSISFGINCGIVK